MTISLSDFDAQRTLFLFDNFNQETSETLIKNMMKLDAKNSEDVNIVINSWGGEVFSLFAILDAMKGLKSNVNTICLGEADSCGAVLLSAGNKRYIGENSRTMIHEVSTFTYGKVSEIEEDLKSAQEINDKLIQHLSDNTGNEFDSLKSMMKKDTFLDATKSKEMNLVDDVLSEPKESDVFTNKVQSFIGNFDGHIKDGTYGKVFYNSSMGAVDAPKMSTAFGGKDVNNAGSTRLLNKLMKGEKVMDKKEMFAALKDNFDCDVAQLIVDAARIPEMEKSVKESLEAKVNAEKVLADHNEAQESENVERLLASLITEGKATQATNEVNKLAFDAIGYTAAKELAEKMPAIAKFEQTGSSANEDESEITDAQKEDKEVKAYAAENKVTYESALTSIRENNKKKGDK